MEKSSAALAQFERELNVINPEEKTSILSARLLQLNSEYTKAQADRVKKEAAYNSVQERDARSRAGIDARRGAEEADRKSERGARKVRRGEESLRHESSGVQESADAGRRSWSRKSPDQAQHRPARGNRISRSRESRSDAANAVKDTKAEFDRLNARSFEYQTLKREADGDKKLYEELVRKIKEAGINASFQNSSIRVADPRGLD